MALRRGVTSAWETAHDGATIPGMLSGKWVWVWNWRR